MRGRLGVAHFFDAVVCSTELGVRKPDARMYLTALARMGQEPSEALFVGHTGQVSPASASETTQETRLDRCTEAQYTVAENIRTA